jgi:hypothetical protein
VFLSKDGIFDLELLGLFNGKTGPIFMGVCGKVAAWSKGIHLTLRLPTLPDHFTILFVLLVASTHPKKRVGTHIM